jgi:hypothetical protein
MPEPVMICGVDVTVFSKQETNLESPLIYEWRILKNKEITTLYIGKAGGGVHRPMVTYAEVVRDLRESRGKRNLAQNPIKHYFPRSVWGFRWIHHQLEAASHRIFNGNKLSERLELHITQSEILVSELANVEKKAIAVAKEKYRGKDIVANDQPSMAVQCRTKLDKVWVLS